MYFSANHWTKQPSVIGRDQCTKWENTRSWYILQKSKTCSVLDRLLEQSDSNTQIPRQMHQTHVSNSVKVQEQNFKQCGKYTKSCSTLSKKNPHVSNHE